MAAYTYLNMVYFKGSQVRISKSLFISVSEGCFYNIKHNADTNDYAALVTKFHIYKISCPKQFLNEFQNRLKIQHQDQFSDNLSCAGLAVLKKIFFLRDG